MKKKGLALVLISAMLGLAACGGKGSDEKTTAETTTEPTEAMTVAATAAPTEAPTEADKSAPLSYTNGEGNTLAFTKYELVEDYEGKSAIAVFFDYTNNGSETKSALFDFDVKLFQDGVECSIAVLTNGPEEINNSMKEVKTGTTIPVSFAYSLSNLTSEVELEVSDLLDFSGNMATQTIRISDGADEAGAQEAEAQAESAAETQAVAEGVIHYTDNDGSTLVYAKHEVTKDYDGNPALVVYFDYTSNSDTAKAAMTSYGVKAFQNGIECGIAMSTSSPEEYQNSIKEVKKGASLPVCWIFSLSDDSDVEIEVGPLFGGKSESQTLTLK